MEYDRRLLQAEQVVEEHPDSALALLGAVDAAALSRADSALYGLLRAQALYKCYLPVSADTLLPQAIRFFEQSGDEHRLTQSYYYSGVIAFSQGKRSFGVKDLKNAERCAVVSRDTLYILKTYESLGMINYSSGNYQMMRNYAKKEIDLAQKAGRRDFACLAYSHIGSSYAVVDSARQALLYYFKALECQPDTDTRASVLSNIGITYNYMSEKDSACYYLEESLRWNFCDNALGTLADIYCQRGDTMRAFAIWQRALQTTDAGLRASMDLKASKYFCSKGKMYEAYELLRQAYTENEKYLSEKFSIETVELQEKYEKETMLLSAAKTQSNFYFLTTLILSLFVLVSITYLYFISYYKKKMSLYLRKVQVLKKRKAAEHEEYRRKINEYNGVIEQLKNKSYSEEELQRVLLEKIEAEKEHLRLSSATRKEIKDLQKIFTESTKMRLLFRWFFYKKENEVIDEITQRINQEFRKGVKLFNYVKNGGKLTTTEKEQTFVDYYVNYLCDSEKEKKDIIRHLDGKLHLQLYYILEKLNYSTEDIGRILNISTSSVRSLKHRLKNTLPYKDSDSK